MLEPNLYLVISAVTGQSKSDFKYIVYPQNVLRGNLLGISEG